MQIARFSTITSYAQKAINNTRFGTKSKPSQSKSKADSTPSGDWYISSKSSFGEYLANPYVRNSGNMNYSDYLKSQGLKETPAYQGMGFGENQEWPGWEYVHSSVIEEEEALERAKEAEKKRAKEPKQKK